MTAQSKMPQPEVPDTAATLAAAGASLGCPLLPSQVDQLLAFIDLLLKWNRVHNLTAVTSTTQALQLHLLDCLAVVAPLRRHLAMRNSKLSPRLLDVGSGGGLPGVVIAIAAPELQVTCVDAIAKKTAFVTQAQAELRLANLTAVHGRAEHLKPPGFDVITSRAVGTLSELITWTYPVLKDDGVWMAMKGTVPDAEIGEVMERVDVFHVEQLHIPTLAAQRCLVWFRPRGAASSTPHQ
jgi:16S rRNA (guanine527-N7)-methyltransferase